jgi:alkaline phosphatase D
MKFIDTGGHGYTVVRATTDTFETEFVCIPRALERSASQDGSPLTYRVRHFTRAWKPGDSPTLEQQILEGNPRFSV